MSKNFLRKYEDGFFDEDELEGVEKLRHHINKQEKALVAVSEFCGEEPMHGP
jgi:hypothetical protein